MTSKGQPAAVAELPAGGRRGRLGARGDAVDGGHVGTASGLQAGEAEAGLVDLAGALIVYRLGAILG